MTKEQLQKIIKEEIQINKHLLSYEVLNKRLKEEIKDEYLYSNVAYIVKRFVISAFYDGALTEAREPDHLKENINEILKIIE